MGLILLGIAITIGTLVVAPGGYFLVSFGPVVAGISRISTGYAQLNRMRAAEQNARYAARSGGQLFR